MSDDKADAPLDPKEAMKRALAAKQAKQTDGEQQSRDSKVSGGPHKAATGKRQFRRKSGG
ncbi:MAG TPA: DUF5302 family protein [Propionibacteriaceae bacterium]|nr:DUF5302 family protein [Propionibacteriaceae bacterium]HPZ49675.1 DUF5302 family protein [Propionibacteriaceae bacterium]HQE31879.1 DUF5302 family protein [Propionibacteriaceae bacterium]